MHTKGKLHSLHCFSRNTDSFKLLIYSESQATTVHFEVQSTSPSPSVHLTTLHRVVTFFQEDWALKASDSQSTERKRKKSQHTQLIIHDAFKACAAALCRYGNWGAQLTYNGGIPHLAVTQCAERKKKSKKKKACVCSDRRGPPWGRKVFSTGWEYGGAVMFDRKQCMCANVCLNTGMHMCGRKHPYCIFAVSTWQF